MMFDSLSNVEKKGRERLVNATLVYYS